jgi:UTP--glucose-1-phosphate uridylyltransferase
MPTPSTRIRKAVFPVAGFGTRFLPATKAQPKEMLPVVDKPLIQYAVEEAYAAGIRDMIFVTGRNKRAIEDHYDTAYELESQLEASGKTALLNIARSVMPDDMTCSYVRQPRMLGLGHAVLCAEHLVGNEPFAVLLADDLMVGPVGGQPVLAQMTEAFERLGGSLLAVQEVPLEHVKRYGIVAGDAIEDGLVKVSKMVEKPKPERTVAPGRGRPLHPHAGRVRRDPQPAQGRRRRDPADRRHRGADEEGIGLRLFVQGHRRYDCGSKEGFLQATVELALAHPEVGAEFREYLKSLKL